MGVGGGAAGLERCWWRNAIMRDDSRPNMNPEFAKALSDKTIMKKLPQPEVGQLWQHRNGLLYRITAVRIEAAGQLRHQNPSGYLHMYECVRSGKVYARLTDHWEKEMQSFQRVELAKNRSGGEVVILANEDEVTGDGGAVGDGGAGG